MKTKKFMTTFLVMIFLFTLTVVSQEKASEKAVVPLTNPNKPAILKAMLHTGSIIVKGYNGKEVTVLAETRTKKINKKSHTMVGRLSYQRALDVYGYTVADKEAQKEKLKKKRAGMKKLKNFTTNLTIEEKNNNISIRADSLGKTVDLTIQVPYRTSLKLTTSMNGEIKINDVSGEFELTNNGGSIYGTNISGSAVATSRNGEINISFRKVTPGKSMAFATWSGDLDVTFPTSFKADLKMTSRMGEIFSDFNVKMIPFADKKINRKRDENGRYQISFNQGVLGKINGGGQEVQLKTFNGDIYVRKGK